LVVPRRPATEPSESSAASVLRLKIRLLEVSPMIWRRVLVTASYTLEELHGVIQVAMGWQSLHLYQFSALCIMGRSICVSPRQIGH
jgi:hypothetical protein